MRKADLEIALTRQYGHRKVMQRFDQNPGPKLIKMCDEKVKQVRKRAAYQANSNNMRHRGKQVLMKGDQIASMPTKELIREIDVEEEEKEYVVNKLKEYKHLVDDKARKPQGKYHYQRQRLNTTVGAIIMEKRSNNKCKKNR